MELNAILLLSLSLIQTREDLFSDQAPKELAILRGHSGSVYCLAFSPNGKTLAVAGGECGKSGEVIVWDVPTRRKKVTLKGHHDCVSSVVFTHDGKGLISGSHDKTIRLWSVSTGEELASLNGHSDAIWCITLSANGQTLASGSADGEVKLWDVASCKELEILKEKGGEGIWSMAISFDGKTLVTGGASRFPAIVKRTGYLNSMIGRVEIWDLPRAERRQALQGSGGSFICSLAFSPDGNTLVAGNTSGELRIWKVGKDRRFTEYGILHISNIKSLDSIKFFPDGRTLACPGGKDGKVRFFDITAKKELSSFKAHTDSVRCLALTLDGFVLSTAGNKTVRIWDVSKTISDKNLK